MGDARFEKDVKGWNRIMPPTLKEAIIEVGCLHVFNARVLSLFSILRVTNALTRSSSYVFCSTRIFSSEEGLKKISRDSSKLLNRDGTKIVKINMKEAGWRYFTKESEKHDYGMILSVTSFQGFKPPLPCLHQQGIRPLLAPPTVRTEPIGTIYSVYLSYNPNGYHALATDISTVNQKILPDLLPIVVSFKSMSDKGVSPSCLVDQTLPVKLKGNEFTKRIRKIMCVFSVTCKTLGINVS